MMIASGVSEYIAEMAKDGVTEKGLLILADYFSENIKPQKTISSETPKYFTRWWRNQGLQVKFKSKRWRNTRGAWAGYEIQSFLINKLNCVRFDHYGTTTVEGHSVFISEPYGYTDDKAVDDCLATSEVLLTPVTFAREAAHHYTCYRFIIWHMYPYDLRRL